MIAEAGTRSAEWTTLLSSLGLTQSETGLGIDDATTRCRISTNDRRYVLALIVTARFKTMDAALFAATRLSELVSRCFELAPEEARLIGSLAGDEIGERTPEAFDRVLRACLSALRLQALFYRGEYGEHHRNLRPKGVADLTGDTIAGEMAQWRSTYRSMAPEQQMMAATIIWLYGSGPDSTWLRRVPCTWTAIEALQYMRDAAVLDIWLRLIANYPGW